jgi:hyperosmotically inducible periplasmic protein
LLKRLFILVVLVVAGAAALYYWKARHGSLTQGFGAALSEEFRDARTTAAVRAAFRLNQALEDQPISVSSEDGVVTLRGGVASAAGRVRAEQVAGATPGVRQVVNHLKIVATLVPSPGDARTLGEGLDDRSLEVRVRLALKLNRALEGSAIEVAVFRREVTLSGEVATRAQREEALRTARETPGAARVVDRLSLRKRG